ncbi:hypothetical protein AVEN_207843-1 [Araneus ventricosus]|uniref:Uncharacterized protein n=1 Tax=Araneus ventricosus TaxID=182803 RepID=A0A4Y2T2K9_ARAVE|nr:hypothetical protein AVEN_207843-1 [Araneus ventricosus]
MRMLALSTLKLSKEPYLYNTYFSRKMQYERYDVKPAKKNNVLLNIAQLQTMMNELPLRSPDLTSLDFFPLYLTKLVYRKPVTSLSDLLIRLDDAFAYVDTASVESCTFSNNTARHTVVLI